MKESANEKDLLNDHLGCFGNFSTDDPMCKKLCALNLRCYIERSRNVRIEIIEELILGNNISKGKAQ